MSQPPPFPSPTPGVAIAPPPDPVAAACPPPPTEATDPVLCGHCGRTATNDLSCIGMCVADSGY